MTSVLLKDLCQIKHGGTPSKGNPAYWIGSIPWVSPKDMKSSVLEDATDHISEEAIAASATSLVPSGTVLVVARSGILAHTLPVARVGRPLAFNQDIKALLPHSDKVDPEYLYWFVRGSEATVLRRGVKKGATVHSLLSGFLENLLVPLPSREQQRRVVDLLSRAERIVRLRRDAQAKMAQFISALFLDMFGDPATNPKGWEAAALGSVADIQGGLQVTRAREQLPLERPYLRVANVYRDRLNLAEIKTIRLTERELDRTRLVRGDLLIVEGHGNPQEVGRAAIWDAAIHECVHQNHLIRVRVQRDRLLPVYASAFLNSESGRMSLLRAGKTTSGLSTISVRNVASTVVTLPPLPLQATFTTRVEAARSIEAQQARAQITADATFRSLLAKTFSGDESPFQRRTA